MTQQTNKKCTCPFDKDTAREIGHLSDCPLKNEKTWWQKQTNKIKWVNECSGHPKKHFEYCQGCDRVAWISEYELDKDFISKDELVRLTKDLSPVTDNEKHNKAMLKLLNRLV